MIEAHRVKNHFVRGYYSAGMFGYCVDHSIYCVMRLKERLDISRKALESGDLITTIDVGTIKRARCGCLKSQVTDPAGQIKSKATVITASANPL